MNDDIYRGHQRLHAGQELTEIFSIRYRIGGGAATEAILDDTWGRQRLRVAGNTVDDARKNLFKELAEQLAASGGTL